MISNSTSRMSVRSFVALNIMKDFVVAVAASINIEAVCAASGLGLFDVHHSCVVRAKNFNAGRPSATNVWTHPWDDV